MKITIDGPAGSGKSFIARGVSKELGIPYLETGLAYRAVAYALLREKKEIRSVSWEDIKPVVEELFLTPRIGSTEVFLRGESVKREELASEEVGKVASLVGTISPFRERINVTFRSIVGDGQAVIEGRDAGTRIFPDAEVKLFITASPLERARRRWAQLKGSGSEESLSSILKKIKDRDERDTKREDSPLVPAYDAFVIDTTDLSPEESLRIALEIIKKHEKRT